MCCLIGLYHTSESDQFQLRRREQHLYRYFERCNLAAEMDTSEDIGKPSSATEDEIDGSFASLARVPSSRGKITFSERETKILELYDELAEIKLEIALLEAQDRITEGEL